MNYSGAINNEGVRYVKCSLPEGWLEAGERVMREKYEEHMVEKRDKIGLEWKRKKSLVNKLGFLPRPIKLVGISLYEKYCV